MKHCNDLNWMNLRTDFMRPATLLTLLVHWNHEFSETSRYRNNENAVQTTANIDLLFDLLVQYKNDLKSDKIGPMSEFWNSFLTMVDIMLDYILNQLGLLLGICIFNP